MSASNMVRRAAVIASSAGLALAVNNGLARTPQMGWNNWNSLGCEVSEKLLLDTSEILVTSGLRDVGYDYVVLDDCWSDGRGDDGYIRVDKHRFPRGMSYVSEQVHARDMRFGMYSSAGELTCARYEGSLDWEENDAKSWASWGVDYLKYDNCYHRGRFGTPEISFNRYNVMAKALNATDRPMLYSLCSWGEDYVHTWGMSIANSWRVSGDIYDSFTRPDALCSCDNPRDPLCVAPGSHCSVLNIINRVAPYVDRGQPGGWNDLDMLEVGQGGMTDDEYVAHFSMWAVLKSPLLIGADLRTLSASALSILNNPAVIAVNQDPLGLSARQVMRNLSVPKDKYGMGETQVWSGPLYGGDQVVVLLNAANEDMSIETDLEDIFVSEGPGGNSEQCSETWDVHDLWSDRMELGVAEEVLKANEKEARSLLRKVDWYNATKTPYRKGLDADDERLMGQKVGQLSPAGRLEYVVPRHSARMFRLRSTNGAAKRYGIYKDEL